MKDLGPMPLEQFLELALGEVEAKAMDEACRKAASGRRE